MPLGALAAARRGLVDEVVMRFSDVAFAFPALLSILREGRMVSFNEVFSYILGPISRRVFIDPVRGALWHAHYAQTIGFFGIAAVPKLAVLFDVVPINVPNTIGVLYESQALSSVSSTVFS